MSYFFLLYILKNHSDFDFQINLAAETTTLAVQDCEGCTNSYESLSNHTCDVYPWWRKVLLYFGPALQNLSIREGTKEKCKCRQSKQKCTSHKSVSNSCTNK